MRIVLATPVYPPEVGGPATYTVEFAKRLRGEHHIVIVAYTDEGTPVPHTHLISVSKRQFLPIRLIKFYFALLREARQSDIIYVQNAVAAGLPAMLVGRRLRKPVILKFVGDEAWERARQARKTNKTLAQFLKTPQGGLYVRLLMMIEGAVLRRVSLVTTPSKYLCELLTKFYGVPKEKLIVNYNAADVPASVATVSRTPHQVMTAVRLVEWKGVDGIIQAVSVLKDNFPDIRLIIAGDGPEKESLVALVRTLRLQDDVTFLGQLAPEKIRELQAQSDVQVLNSRYEGLPHGVIEGFATQTPIVATDIPGTDEAVYHEKTGLLVPPGDTRALAKAIERLFRDEPLRMRIIKGGEELLSERFSWEAHLERFNGMLRSLGINKSG